MGSLTMHGGLWNDLARVREWFERTDQTTRDWGHVTLAWQVQRDWRGSVLRRTLHGDSSTAKLSWIVTFRHSEMKQSTYEYVRNTKYYYGIHSQ